jgi:hypothetical protein
LIWVTRPLKIAEDRFKPSAGPTGARQVQASAGFATMISVPKVIAASARLLLIVQLDFIAAGKIPARAGSTLAR